MVITQFTKSACSELRASLDAALATVAAKHGLKISLGSMVFSGGNVRTKLEAAVVNASTGVAETREATDFRRYSFHHGLPEKLLGLQFTAKGRTFKVIGYRTKAPARPFILEENGRTVVCDRRFIESAFAEAAKANPESLMAAAASFAAAIVSKRIGGGTVTLTHALRFPSAAGAAAYAAKLVAADAKGDLLSGHAVPSLEAPSCDNSGDGLPPPRFNVRELTEMPR